MRRGDHQVETPRHMPFSLLYRILVLILDVGTDKRTVQLSLAALH